MLLNIEKIGISLGKNDVPLNVYKLEYEFWYILNEEVKKIIFQFKWREVRDVFSKDFINLIEDIIIVISLSYKKRLQI